MPIQVKYLDNGLGVLCIGEGIVTGDDIINSNYEIFSSVEKMEKYKYGLIDYSNVSYPDVSSSDIEIIVSQDKKDSEFIRNAFIAVSAKQVSCIWSNSHVGICCRKCWIAMGNKCFQ